MVVERLARFGFRFGRGSTHTSRTLMLQELSTLLSYVDRSDAAGADYRHAIEEENCLGKRSGKTRRLTYRHLRDLYTLSPSFVVFRALLFFWKRDVAGRPLLALLCACTRDSILRISVSFILGTREGAVVQRNTLEEFIENNEPGRFSPATLAAAVRNLMATWTNTGHLSGRNPKLRSQAAPTPGATAYALLLGYLSGIRGEALFRSGYINLLDCSFQQAVDLAEDAARRGWIVFKRLGDVVEVVFPGLLTTRELEGIREQN
ncbi:MAG: hypothetical protein JST22_04595 [Bacteroidetes bacterium]|nr:hypothetical protein [Bacteroidota bacterium]